MAMSDAYWNATKPSGMPDHVWKAQQEAKKAEKEAKKKAEEAAKKAAEEAAKKKAEEANKVINAAANGAPVSTEALVNAMLNSGGSGITPSTQDKINGFAAATIGSNMALQEAAKKTASNNAASNSTSAHNGTSTNDARAEQMAIKNNTTPNYSKDYTGYEADTSAGGKPHSSGSARIPNGSSNTSTQTNGSGSNTNTSTKKVEEAEKDKTYPVNSYSPETGYVPNYAPVSTPSTNVNNSAGGTSSGNSSTVSSPSQSTTYAPPPTADEVAKYALAIMQAAKGEFGAVEKPTYKTAEKPGAVILRSLEDLAKTYGITYDYDTLYNLFNDSVEAQYEAIYAKQRQNEAAYYDNATAAQNTLLDTLSRDRSSAVQAGVSKGMQAANALGAMLGVSQQFASNATALSQERGNTAKDYGAALAKAVVDAEKTSNERKTAIMEIAKMLYGYDSEQYVANMDNYNTILTNNAALQQTHMNNQTALKNALASIFNNSAANKISAEANRLAAQYAAKAQRYAAQQSYLSNQEIAQANKDAASITAEANKWIAGLQSDLFDNNEVKQNPNGYVPVADLNRITKTPTAYTNASNLGYSLASNLLINNILNK